MSDSEYMELLNREWEARQRRHSTKVNFPLTWRKCLECDGTGFVRVSKPPSTLVSARCAECHGTGHIAGREPRLTVELVPSTCWWSNVRSNVSKADWEKCKRMVRVRSGDRCEICGGQGKRWPVECHEIWRYDEVCSSMGGPTGGIQTLVDLIALCPMCHRVKHLGRSMEVGDGDRALAHLAKVNNWSEDTVSDYVAYVFNVWRERSQHSWDLDITLLSALGIAPAAPKAPPVPSEIQEILNEANGYVFEADARR